MCLGRHLQQEEHKGRAAYLLSVHQEWHELDAVVPQSIDGTKRCGLCNICTKGLPVCSVHYPQRREHGKRAACLLSGHQDWQDPSAQVCLPANVFQQHTSSSGSDGRSNMQLSALLSV